MQKNQIASCHCGLVEFELHLENGIVEPTRCNCSFCRRRGAVVATIPATNLTVTKGNEFLRLYQFHSKTARHYFCSNCGIYTHHQRRLPTNEYGFNVGCLNDANPLEIKDIAVYDGINHDADKR